MLDMLLNYHGISKQSSQVLVRLLKIQMVNGESKYLFITLVCQMSDFLPTCK